MVPRTRLMILLFMFALLVSQGSFGQEGADKKPCTDSTAADEHKAMLARTHCEVLNCVQKFLYFSNLSQPTELQDVVNAIRALGDIQRVQQILGPQMIIVEGTPEQVALAEKLAVETDKAKRRFGALGYRIDFKIQESEGDKKLNSRLYSVVTESHQVAKVSIGKPAPVQNDAASDTTQPSAPSNKRSIEVHIIKETERMLELSVDAEFSTDVAGDPSGFSPLLKDRTNLMVELDKPTVVTRIDDPNSDRSFMLELTATRIKEKS